MKKLTLSVNEKVIKKAKYIASERGTNVSAMFSQFIEALSGLQEQEKRSDLPPVTRSVLGIAKLPKGKPYKETIGEALVERYK